MEGPNHGSIDPFGDVWTGSPIPACGSQKGIKETFRPGGLQKDMIVPSHSAVERKSKVLST